MSNPEIIIVRIQGFDKKVSDAEIKKLCDKYKPISYGISRFERNTDLGFFQVETKTEEDAAKLITAKNNTKWDKLKMSAKYLKTDTSKKIVIFGFHGLNKTEKEVREYLKDFSVKKVEKMIEKKGELNSSYVSVFVKDIATAENMIDDLNNTEYGKKEITVVACHENGKRFKPCFVCGKLGHNTNKCPQKEKEQQNDENEKKSETGKKGGKKREEFLQQKPPRNNKNLKN
ncbi:hypothetical protein EIN_015000 [Entamoeba invadens IP1]|uniref:hypothetical protein n=1 Tax=Entamoeba invadens IP1 TaxID=370355 RepID=UPI0002C3DE4B|nr:hypothetical protein EIN_015000 [Entamoeba invadens IP1]ELP90371.1 hypothetical protein EIN_015000 [Entamoeba invadens IP1]|eukprot:XP_004257142.1 hypothetical protein EIN_015000 [Entamoeba invadens IP1]